jgi:hypothetical protein
MPLLPSSRSGSGTGSCGSIRTCQIAGCLREHFADGYCNPHYKRKRRYGDPVGGGRFRDESDAIRLSHLYAIQPGGCWLWQGAIDRVGYGEVWWRGKRHRAHRAVYAALRGEWPVHELDHLCRVKHCVNPDHLEPVSHSENLRRHYAKTVEACPYGHPYDEDNTYMDKGKRRCRECMRQRQRYYRARKRSN